jgi:hypothetical protein
MSRGGPGSNVAVVPDTLVPAVVSLAGAGPVHLGAYTAAELTAVDAIVDFLEAEPPDEVLAEAVRSLAARELLIGGSDGGGGQMRVRGDLGIAVALQQRARVVLDARVTGTRPGEPWRMLLLPQPEPICLLTGIDALGVHKLSLFPTDDTLDEVAEWLPDGDRSETTDAGVLDAADRSALVTVTRYTTEGSAEIAGASTDLILASHSGQVYAFGRDTRDRSTLVVYPWGGRDVRATVAAMLA